MYRKCILCGKSITRLDVYNNNYRLFGMDGDFVHSKCYEHKDEYFLHLDNMTNNEFRNWVTGKENENDL